MSVTDPLLKTLKLQILELYRESTDFGDNRCCTEFKDNGESIGSVDEDSSDLICANPNFKDAQCVSGGDDHMKRARVEVADADINFDVENQETVDNVSKEICAGDDDVVQAEDCVENKNSIDPGSDPDVNYDKLNGNADYDKNDAWYPTVSNNPDPITDDHPHLTPLCRTLEEIFRKGLQPTSGSMLSLSIKRDDFWSWIESHLSASPPLPPPLRSLVDATSTNERTLTYIGKGRLLIRSALQKKLLFALLDLQCKNVYDPRTSIIGNEILAQILSSLLRQLATFEFQLDLDNASFLDSSWQLPLRKNYEMVPCPDLGVILKYVMGRVMVAAVEPGSVGGEDKKIEAGDVFDQIFGKCLRKAKRGRVANLMAENRGRPISLSVIKCKLPSGDIFPPLMHVVRQLSNEVEILRIIKHEEEMRSLPKPPSTILGDDLSDMVPAQNPLDNPNYRVWYVGEVFVGTTGGVDRIEEGVGRALEKYGDARTNVTLHLAEKDVLVSVEGKDKYILKHSYPEISSCGRRVDCRKFFAYIAGETTCSMSSKFVCHVFQASSELESKNILCGIAQGFERTHWAI